jgi:hypothetical protein
METIKKAIKCSSCLHILARPVLLPCGHSICQKHVKHESKEFHCLACDTISLIPKQGFPQNQALAVLIEENIQQTKFPSLYEEAMSSFKILDKKVDDMKKFQTDPYFFVNQTIGELKRETEIMREEFKISIDHMR